MGEDPTTLQNLGVLYFERGKFAESGAALERAIAVLRRKGWNPIHGSVLYYSLGAAYLRLGDRGKTEEVLKRAIQEDPKNEAARETLRRIKEQPPASP